MSTPVDLRPSRQASAIPVTSAAIGRSMRMILRSPALLIAPLAQSLFFLVVYEGQLGSVGATYLSGSSFVGFVLPLIVLVGAATGAGAAGTLVLGDITSGYLDRLRLAHGTINPFVVGAVVAALGGVAIQTVVTVAGATLVGYRPENWTGLVGMFLVLMALSIGIALLGIAVAIRTVSASATGLVTLAVFGLSFFTGVFAPVDELSPWMRMIAIFNPLTSIVELARQLESGKPLTDLPLALVVLATLIIVGTAACALAQNHSRRNR